MTVADMPARLVLFTVALALVAVTPPPAEACDGCTPPTLAELVDSATHVYAGRVTAVDGHQITIAVDAVWKGAPAAEQTFTTKCRFARKREAKLIVLDNEGRPGKFIDPCLRVKRDTDKRRVQLEELAGAPHAP
jgi:hypothetical protein